MNKGTVTETPCPAEIQPSLHMNQDVQEDSQVRKRKREENLKNWRWEEVIDIDEDDSEDDKGISGWEQLFDDINLGDLMNEAGEVPKEPAKKKRKPAVRVFNAHKVRRLFEDDDDKYDTNH